MAGVIAVLGAGRLGEALLAGLLRSGTPAADILVTARRPERAKELTDTHGVEVVTTAEAAGRADVLLLGVKPQDMAALLAELGPHVTPGTLVVSLAAGLTTAKVAQALPTGTAVVRVMSNTPVLVDEAMSVMSAGEHATEADLARVRALLEPVGRVAVVPEYQQDAVTAVSGSGPAYVFYLVEAMIDAGVGLGLQRAVANELVLQTVLGAATLLRESGERPAVLRENVTSPAGTTVAAVRQLDARGVRAALYDALEAARDRACELGGG